MANSGKGKGVGNMATVLVHVENYAGGPKDGTSDTTVYDRNCEVLCNEHGTPYAVRGFSKDGISLIGLEVSRGLLDRTDNVYVSISYYVWSEKENAYVDEN